MLQRSTLVIGFCLVITITFCSVFLLYSMNFLSSCICFRWIGMVTLMICLIMITTVVFGYRQPNEIVVVPIGTLFAFTRLRSTMSGAPEGFGVSFPFPYMGQGLDSSSNSTRRYTRHGILNIGGYQLTYLFPTQIFQGYYHASSSCRSVYVHGFSLVQIFIDV